MEDEILNRARGIQKEMRGIVGEAMKKDKSVSYENATTSYLLLVIAKSLLALDQINEHLEELSILASPKYLDFIKVLENFGWGFWLEDTRRGSVVYKYGDEYQLEIFIKSPVEYEIVKDPGDGDFEEVYYGDDRSKVLEFTLSLFKENL